ncbi:MAG: sigma-54-dependent Fis family transcriptional regulator [Proteobacteria bacterium]|nr:sigma-54-dependent Fis family transcriptional regulator [Pseudomonadota bacterium]
MTRKKILIVEDEVVIRSSLKKFLEKKNYKVCEASSVEGAVKQDLGRFCLIITDLRLPGPPGTDIIRLAPHVPVLVMTSYASLKSAVETMKLGAVDYIAKPFDFEDLLKTIHKLIEEPNQTSTIANMLGNCDAMVELFSRLRKVAPTDSNVLIVGESGTGKELVAKAIHNASAQSSKKMILLNCAAIPHTLIESELFGHEKGAFTGATSARVGLVEAADGSTLFLDEIGELTLEAQARLLRVLQEGEVRRVGSVETKKVSVRLIAATHRDLKTLVKDKQFREDLYYRLNVFKLELPPLRDRQNDLMLIADHVLQRITRKLKKQALTFTEQTREVISQYGWPGNVRELENAIERAVILCESCSITPELLAVEAEAPHRSVQDNETAMDDNVSLKDYFQQFVLKNQDQMTETELALKLGISRKSLWQKRQKLDIPRKKSRKK